MKKFILFTISFFTLSLSAETASEKMIDFLKMEKEHKTQMLNKKLKKIQEWFDFKINAYKDLESLTDISQKDELIKKQLDKAIALHEKQLDEFKSAHDKEIAEFKAFKESLEPKKEVAEEMETSIVEA